MLIIANRYIIFVLTERITLLVRSVSHDASFALNISLILTLAINLFGKND